MTLPSIKKYLIDFFYKGTLKFKNKIVIYYSYLFLSIPFVVVYIANKIKNLINPLEKNNFSIICYSYSFEVSPFLKSICSYFYDNGFGETDVFIDKLERSNLSSQKGVNIITWMSPKLIRFFRVDLNVLFFFSLKLLLKENRYKYVLAVDFLSLNLINKNLFPLNEVIFLSFEGTDYMRHFPKQDVVNILSKCQTHLIASKERGKEINDFFRLNINFIYFPISLRPAIEMIKQVSLFPKIIFSGYFAEWSALGDLIDLFINSDLSNKSNLYLQGHFYGTDEYLKTIKGKIASQTNIAIDNSYYSDKNHHELLSKFDIGIAFYKNIQGVDNFENLIFSSGKIASYLWAGLAVMTNIDCELTKNFPFIFIGNLEPRNFINGLKIFQNNKDEIYKSAYILAETNYNFDTYMADIFDINTFPLAQKNKHND